MAELVRPAVAALLAERDISSFYFVRYNLGGPHVRLRVKPAPGRAGKVGDRIRQEAAGFFERSPSTAPVSEETILRQNQGIVAFDPLSGGTTDAVFPDNSVQELPVFFEVERYGGGGLLRYSLDFFALSSAAALRFVSGYPGRSAGQRLSGACRFCIRQAWALARDGGEFTKLLDYASHLFSGEIMARFANRGDEAFERQRGAYSRLLREELAALVASTGPVGDGSPAIAAGASRLARRIRHLDDGARWIVAASQLHMTANRLGLLNPEELYLGRILSRASQELAACEPDFWREAWSAHRRQGRATGGRPRELPGATLEHLLRE